MDEVLDMSQKQRRRIKEIKYNVRLGFFRRLCSRVSVPTTVRM